MTISLQSTEVQRDTNTRRRYTEAERMHTQEQHWLSRSVNTRNQHRAF